MFGDRGGDADPGDGLRVRSGAGGTSAVVADLEATAACLAQTGQELGELAAETFLLATDPYVLGTVLLSPVTGLAAEAALAELVAGINGLGAWALRVGALGVALNAAAQMYRSADALTSSLLDRVLVNVVGITAPAWLMAVAVTGASGRGRALVSLLAKMPDSGDRFLGAVPTVMAERLPLGFGVVAPRSPQEIARVASATGAGTGLLHETAAVRVVKGAPVVGSAPSGVGDVAARVGVTARTSEGTVRVERVVGPDGGRAWIVEIPGTQDWSPTSTNPLDSTSAVAAEAGYASAASMLVATAMVRSGVRPGEPVMLVGHSLGGMAAAQVAADPKLRGTASVTHVVTMGSPIAAVKLPAEVKVLSLEHDDDPVPWLDGAPNPDQANWVTVRDDEVQVAAPQNGGDESVMTGHGIEQYVRTAQRVDASTDPSVAEWRSGTEVFFDRPGAMSTSWEVSGLRVR